MFEASAATMYPTNIIMEIYFIGFLIFSVTLGSFFANKSPKTIGIPSSNNTVFSISQGSMLNGITSPDVSE